MRKNLLLKCFKIQQVSPRKNFNLEQIVVSDDNVITKKVLLTT